MKFNEKQYKELLNSGDSNYSQAIDMLETAIATSDIKTAIELKKLRTPGKVTHLELARLREAGFDMSKKEVFGINEECSCLVLAFHAGYEHCKKYWPHLIERYDMSMYPLPKGEL